MSDETLLETALYWLIKLYVFMPVEPLASFIEQLERRLEDD